MSKLPPAPAPQDLAAHLSSYSPQQLAKMDHSLLYAAREHLPQREQQNYIGPYEHRAFAREATAEKPWLALPILAGTVAYQPYKALMGKSRSDPSMDQVVQGVAGVGEGLWNAFKNALPEVSLSRTSHTANTGRPTSATDLLVSLQKYQ